jgi:hypothetical protein
MREPNVTEKPIYARANPASVKVIESYFFEKKLSRNPFIGPGQSPEGKIEIIMPYDGDQYFTRQAYRDVEKQLNSKPLTDREEAQFGHLAFSDYERTDLRDVLRLNKRYGSFPLCIPVLGPEITNIEQLYQDTHTSKITFKYKPDWPDGWPIEIELDLWDEETLSLGTEDQQLAQVAEQVNQQINFRPNLLLRSQLFVNLQSRMVRKDIQPRLTQMFLRWPTFTSFRGLELDIGSNPAEKSRVMYNPQTRGLEWGNILLNVNPEDSNAAWRVFSTEWMDLFINYPGDLSEQSSIKGNAIIEIPGILLSGTQVRLFDAIGAQRKETSPKLISRLNLEFELILDEAFAKRKRSPYQHLYFDEVIPDKMRIADIKTAIADRGFTIIPGEPPMPTNIIGCIRAERLEGPEKMKLVILIEGNRQDAERATQVKGGQTFKSSTESGDLKVYVRGEMHGNSKRLTQEMNALHALLHERFERLRSRR